jgi:hypothetical protein
MEGRSSIFENTVHIAVILLDWSSVDLTPKPAPYAEKVVEFQDSRLNIYYK